MRKFQMILEITLDDLSPEKLAEEARGADMKIEELETLDTIKSPVLIAREIVGSISLLNDEIFEGSDFMVQIVDAKIITPSDELKWMDTPP